MLVYTSYGWDFPLCSGFVDVSPCEITGGSVLPYMCQIFMCGPLLVWFLLRLWEVFPLPYFFVLNLLVFLVSTSSCCGCDTESGGQAFVFWCELPIGGYLYRFGCSMGFGSACLVQFGSWIPLLRLGTCGLGYGASVVFFTVFSK